jgi:hypothetical protein
VLIVLFLLFENKSPKYDNQPEKHGDVAIETKMGEYEGQNHPLPYRRSW